MSLADIADTVDGRLTGGAAPGARVTASVEHDSRKITPGGLFVALTGEHADGHDFADRAHDAGAVAVLAAREVAAPAIVVDDVLAALGRLARVVVDRLPRLTTVAITGSSGKTSTKDMLAQMCQTLGPTVSNAGNFNNELGHPYTVCQADESTRYLVVEMGARGIGHIEYLCDISPPDIGVVLNVGISHLDGFGSIEVTARAKSEMAAAVGTDGVAVLNADDPRVAAMTSVTTGRVITFGTGDGADIRATDVTCSAGRPSFRLCTPRGSAPVTLRLHGGHHVANALAVAAVGHELGMPPADIATALGAAERRSARRMDVITRDDGITLIDDSYNANPASMAAALAALADIGAGGRRIAVLGYMADLMEQELAAHTDVGRLAAGTGVDTLIVVDEAASGIADGAADSAVTVLRAADQDAAIETLDRIVRPNDTVLVKASRYRTWRIADHLRVGSGHREDTS